MTTIEMICASLGGVGGLYAAIRFIAEMVRSRQAHAIVTAEAILTKEHTGRFAAEGAKLHAESEKITVETVRSWIDQLRASSAKIEARLDHCESAREAFEIRSNECERRALALSEEMAELRRLMGLPT